VIQIDDPDLVNLISGKPHIFTVEGQTQPAWQMNTTLQMNTTPQMNTTLPMNATS
jgi:hypothetical protein